jgi:hypothetical protein
MNKRIVKTYRPLFAQELKCVPRCAVVGPKENMDCIYGIEMETDQNDVSSPIDTK